MPGNGFFHMLFSSLKWIKNNLNKYIQLESQWQVYFIFEKTNIALELFVSEMDCTCYNIGNWGAVDFRKPAGRSRGASRLLLPCAITVTPFIALTFLLHFHPTTCMELLACIHYVLKLKPVLHSQAIGKWNGITGVLSPEFPAFCQPAALPDNALFSWHWRSGIIW